MTLRDYTRTTVGPATWHNALVALLSRALTDTEAPIADARYRESWTVGETVDALRASARESAPRTITTADVWSALPYAVRAAMCTYALTGSDKGWPDPWTLDRVQVTPWNLLPQEIREALHGITTCQDAG